MCPPQYRLICWAILFVSVLSSQYSESPEASFATLETKATSIGLSPVDTSIIVGYESSKIAVYKPDGSQVKVRSIETNPVVGFLSWVNGWVAMYKQGRIYTLASGDFEGSADFSDEAVNGLLSGTYAEKDGQQYAGINIGNAVVEYRLDQLTKEKRTQTFKATKDGELFSSVCFTANKEYLYASTETENMLHAFKGADGSLVNSAQMNSSLTQITWLSENLAVGISGEGKLIKIDQTGIKEAVEDAPQNPILLSKCRDTDYFAVVTADKSIKMLNSATGATEQTLSVQTVPIGVNCDDEYLVVVDADGTVVVFHYYGFPTWAYFAIAGAVLILLIIGIYCYCKKRLAKKKDKKEALKTVGKDYKKIKEVDEKADKYMPEDIKREKEKQQRGFTAFFKEQANKIKG